MNAPVNKACFKCGEIKPLSEFYKHPQMADGHVNKCKVCNKKDVHEHRLENLDKIQEYDRTRRKKGLVSDERWEEISTKRKEYSQAYYAANPDKWEERLRKARKANYMVDDWEVLSAEKREWSEEYYTQNPDKWEERLAKSRKASKTPEEWEELVLYKRKYARDNYDPTKCQEYRARNPKKYSAHSKVAYAIKIGTLVKQPCEVCGCENTHAHHCDYDKPLDVMWLCPEHHHDWHRLNGEGLNAH